MLDRLLIAFYSAVEKFPRVVRVVVKAAPTYLALAVLVAPIVAEEAASVLPAPWAEGVTALALKVVLVASAVLNVIRRVSPVEPDRRGLLPDRGAADHLVLAVVVFLLGVLCVKAGLL